MKEGWEYKKLGEICNIYQPKTISTKELVEEGKYFVYGANGIIGKYNSYNHEGSEVLMTCRGATCGTINVSKPYSWINGNAMVIHPLSSKLSSSFLVYLLKGMDLSDVITGAAQPQITRQSLAPKKISIPPLSEQQHIVEELDLLSSIIEKKNAQLNELDNLAQSLFNEMFGDPITNEKGWEVKKIGDCFSYIKNGANIKQTKGASGYPITRIETLSNSVFNRDRLGYANIYDLTKYTNYVLNDGDLLMSHINSKAYIGRTVMYKKEDEEKIIHGMNLLRLVVIYDLLIPTFADYYFKTEFFKDEVAKIRKDAVNQSSMAIGDLKMIRIFLPPLALQQIFASKIEAIEHQKELIKQSIKEVETLFNSRMDYYFN